MFSPRELGLERGWPGRIDGDRVVQLAAQTLQAFFTGGGESREHAVFPLDDVALRAPVLHPPAVRIFDAPDEFAFANPSAILGPGESVPNVGDLEAHARVTAIIGMEAIGGYTLMAEVRARGLGAPKDRDFALCLGPVVETELETEFDFEAAHALAARNTRLYPGDLLAAPAHEVLPVGDVSYEGIGALRNPVAQ